jgi:GNAT superfamily N-acetyltransferase
LADALFPVCCHYQSERPNKRKEIEMENLVHKRAGQTHSQRPQIDAQRKVVGRDARAVSIRVATPDDKEKLRKMFSRLSSKTIYRRFHLAYPHVPEQMLDLMSDVDHYDKEALFAVAEEEIVGHAMYVKLANSGDAEVAFVVEDEWQSKGVGKLLLDEIAEKARLRGIETFSGEVLGENRRAVGLLNAVFAKVRYVTRDGLYHFRVSLQTLKPTARPVGKLRRAA